MHAVGVELRGKDRLGHRGMAAAACGEIGRRLHRVAAENLPTSPAELEAVSRLLDRENALAASAMLFEAPASDAGDGFASRSRAWSEFLHSLHSLTIVASTGGFRHDTTSRLLIHVPPLL